MKKNILKKTLVIAMVSFFAFTTLTSCFVVRRHGHHGQGGTTNNYYSHDNGNHGEGNRGKKKH